VPEFVHWSLVSSENFTIYQRVSGVIQAVFSNWTNKRYNAGTYSANLLIDIFGQSKKFSYPKSVYTVRDVIDISIRDEEFVQILDYFAGSGTTGHAVIKFNREDGGTRRYILVEMGTYFDTVTKPRIQKVIYSDNWKDGKPQDTDGIRQLFKYFKLESYEDTLNNLTLAPRSTTQQTLLDNHTALRQDFTLNYMLDVETRGSQSLLNVEGFRKPFGYTMQILGNDNEMVEQAVDLVETFNYLIGLHVRTRENVRGVVVIQGHLVQTGERVLVL
jgi:adenine-specific DNA-methyltransferase